MNQENIKKMMDEIFEEKSFDVISNTKDGQRNVFVCRKGEKKRLIAVWPNRDLVNIVLQSEVQEGLDNIGFKFAVEPIIEGNRYDYRKVTETHALKMCRWYLESVENKD